MTVIICKYFTVKQKLFLFCFVIFFFYFSLYHPVNVTDKWHLMKVLLSLKKHPISGWNVFPKNYHLLHLWVIFRVVYINHLYKVTNYFLQKEQNSLGKISKDATFCYLFSIKIKLVYSSKHLIFFLQNFTFPHTNI